MDPSTTDQLLDQLIPATPGTELAAQAIRPLLEPLRAKALRDLARATADLDAAQDQDDRFQQEWSLRTQSANAVKARAAGGLAALRAVYDALGLEWER